jgi:hypothetical protein
MGFARRGIVFMMMIGLLARIMVVVFRFATGTVAEYGRREGEQDDQARQEPQKLHIRDLSFRPESWNGWFFLSLIKKAPALKCQGSR